jgi:hypothetical protein
MFDTRGVDRREHGERIKDAEGGWRHAHEVQGLLDTLSIYRRYAVDLTAENTMLREQVSVLTAIATASLNAERRS